MSSFRRRRAHAAPHPAWRVPLRIRFAASARDSFCLGAALVSPLIARTSLWSAGANSLWPAPDSLTGGGSLNRSFGSRSREPQQGRKERLRSVLWRDINQLRQIEIAYAGILGDLVWVSPRYLIHGPSCSLSSDFFLGILFSDVKARPALMVPLLPWVSGTSSVGDLTELRRVIWFRCYSKATDFDAVRS